jgi:hypothetical protein
VEQAATERFDPDNARAWLLCRSGASPLRATHPVGARQYLALAEYSRLNGELDPLAKRWRSVPESRNGCVRGGETTVRPRFFRKLKINFGLIVLHRCANHACKPLIFLTGVIYIIPIRWVSKWEFGWPVRVVEERVAQAGVGLCEF